MPAASRLRALGFRRWYERQLVESHAWLVTGILSLIALFATLELFVAATGWRLFGALAIMAVAGAACVMAFRRYLLMLAYAEHVAGHRRCETCGTGGAEVLDAGAAHEGGEEGWIRLRCRRCSRQWLVE